MLVSTDPWAGADPVSRAAFIAHEYTLHEWYPVADTTARAAYLTALAAAGITVSASNPARVYRANSTVGLEHEVTEDGTTWYPVPARPPTTPVVRVTRQSTAQAIPTSTSTAMVFDTYQEDVSGMLISPWSTLEIPAGAGGLWFFSALVKFDNFTSGYGKSIITVAGTTVWDGPEQPGHSVSAGVHGSFAGIIRASAGQLVRLQAYQTSGGDVDATAKLDLAWMMA